MSDYDDYEAEAAPEPEAPASSSDDALAKKLAEMEKDNYKLRGKLRRAELNSKFGSEIAELVPDELPHDKWEEYAEKLQGLRGPLVEEQATEASEDEAEAAPTEAELKLAAAASSPTTGTAPVDVSAKEILKLVQEGHHAEAEKLIRAKYQR